MKKPMTIPYLKMMNKKANILFLSFVLCVFSIHTVFAVEIHASVDRHQVNMNESFQLTYTATEPPDEDPDFSPLDKDFEILNQRHSNKSSWVNGKSSKSIQWVLNIMAKRAGKLLIPSINFGDDSSKSTHILIAKNIIKSTASNKELFLEVEATPKQPYVQSQVIYTIRLYRRVQVTQASLNEPKLADAVIEKLGEDKNYSTDVNGVSYFVTERKYAIFPQKSGLATIKSLVLTAEIVSKAPSRFNGFFNRQSTKSKRVSSKEITLQVQAAPKSFSGKQWIPAESLYIREQWSGDASKMKVGEPLTRTLILFAKGATVSQLPELHRDIEIIQLKTYPDQPVLKEPKQAEGVIAIREEKIAYIPSKSGSYTLPAIEIPWFNTKTQKMEIARIAAKTVTALASAESTLSNPVTTTPIQANAATTEPAIQMVESKTWMWLSIFLAVGWLLTVFLFIRKGKPKQQVPPVNKKEVQLKQSIKTLKQACKENNPAAAKDALLTWGKIKFNETNLSTIASHCEARLRDETLLLNQNIYASQTEPWQGKKLFQYFTENKAREKVAKKLDDGLEPLYRA